MVLCVDVDDVICNLQETVIKLFNTKFGANYTLDNFIEYDVMNILPEPDGLVMKEMYSKPGLYNKVKPISGAQNALQKLINQGHQVYLVTSNIPSIYCEKVEFIKKYFPFINEDHIVYMNHKWMLKCDIMIEDNLQNLLEKPDYHRICFNRPWNQSNKDYVYDIHRCYNWDDILATINKINELE